MTIAIYLVVAGALIFLNAFFVLAEFAAVKMRRSRVEQLAAEGHSGAKLLQHIQAHLDQYLSVCQVGITLASIGLGFVGGAKFAATVAEATGLSSGTALAITVGVLYVLVSVLHIVLGEQVPKMLALYEPEKSSLLIVRPLRWFRAIFYLPLVILNGATMAILRVFGVRGQMREAEHSEDELRIILAQSQSTGMMSFRRLLFLENIFDLGDVKVADAMRPRAGVKVLQAGSAWEENFKVIRESRFSRFPLVDGTSEMPVGVVHVKDLLYEGPGKMAGADLRKLARPYFTTGPDVPLENLLGDLQRHRGHLAMVKDAAGKWVGFISLEDIIEEVIGTIEDEFEVEPPLFLADAMAEDRIVLGIRAATLSDAVVEAFARVKEAALPLPAARIKAAVLEREKAMSTYLGNGLAVPHARLEGLQKPALLFARSEEGVPVKGREDRAHLIFVLMTPAGQPRVQVRLLARVCGLIDSEYVAERLRQAETPAAVLEAIRAGEPVTVR